MHYGHTNPGVRLNRLRQASGCPSLPKHYGLTKSGTSLTRSRVVTTRNLASRLPYCFSGSSGAVFLKRKHTARLNIRAVVPGAVDHFLERAEAFCLDIDRMRDHRLTDDRAKAILHDTFASGVMPIRLFPAVSKLYFDDESQFKKFPERNLWSLNNAATEAVKSLRPATQQECGDRKSVV